MSKIRTKNFKAKVLKLTRGEYSVIGEYPLINGRILMRHNNCRYEWMVKPSKFTGDSKTKGTRCPNCNQYGKSKKLTDMEVQDRIDAVHGKGEYILVEGTYTSSVKQMVVVHRCGYEWHTMRSSIIEKKITCPRCSGRMRTMWTAETFGEKIKDMSNGEYELDSDFTIVQRVVEIKHVKCGRVKTVTGSSALKGSYKCDMCKIKEGKSNESVGEKKIREYLESHDIIFETQYKTDDCKYKRQLPFDFAILDDDNTPLVMIEFDGEQHYNRGNFFGSDEYTAEYDLEKQQIRDSIKDEYCNKNGILMLRIPYTSINRIDSILNRFFRVHKNFL